jgi:phosphoglycerate-specific signal transduction histidine kinase
MANNRADGVLMPVINGEIRAATGFKQRELRKLTREIVFAGGGFRRRRRFGTVAERRQAETRRDHPQQEMRPEIPSAKLSPARQYSTHLLHHISQPVTG